MSMRFLVYLAAALSISIAYSGPLFAQEQEGVLELKRLQASLSIINSEIKADLDQILALQEAIKTNSRTPMDAQPGRSPDVALYEDTTAAQRLAIQRDAAISARLDAILARTAALDAQKQRLLERVLELGVVP